MSQPQDKKGFLENAREQYNLMTHALQVAAFPIRVYTTRFGTWGDRYQPVHGFVGCFFWPPLFAMCYGGHPHTGDLFLFWFVTLGMLVLHKLAGSKLRKQGYQSHSRYWGRSRSEWGTSFEATKRARATDGFLAFCAGVILVAAGSDPLGAFVLIGSLAKLVADALAVQGTEARLREMADARLETEYYADLFRERHF